MKIVMAGLGRMGMNMSRRLPSGRQQVAAYKRRAQKTRQPMAEEAAGKLGAPRTVWLMLPAGSVGPGALKDLLTKRSAHTDQVPWGAQQPQEVKP